MDPRTPIIVGVGQVTNREKAYVEALDLMEQASVLALEDAGTKIAPFIDCVQVVNAISHTYANPPGDLADRLKLPDGIRQYTAIGGNTPQWLIGKAGDAIQSGSIKGVLIAGAEAGDSAKRARKDGVQQAGARSNTASTCEVIGDGRMGAGPAEMAAGLMGPPQLYPLLENAIAHRAGRSPEEQRHFLATFMARATQVAASHPDLAWFPQERSAAEIAEITPQNRMIGEPYPKLMNAIMSVDQGASIILTSVENAEAAGIPRSQWVFPWSSADCNDVFYPAERPDLSRSPGIAAAGKLALTAAGVGVDDIATFDFYSCFPCAVEMGAEALGISVDDPRGMTVTGGLAYFGGPGNNYVAHSIATTVDLCRETPENIGLVTGLGWYVTKHAVGLYSATPPPRGWQRPDPTKAQKEIDDTALEVDLAPSGTVEVEAMTVLHDRVAGPVAAPIIGRLKNGKRVVALTEDPSLPAQLAGTSLTGTRVSVTSAAQGGAPVYRPL